MRIITQQASRAFRIGSKNYKRDNTRVSIDKEGGKYLYLHDNLIARENHTESLEDFEISLAGWPTPTTRERLNGLLQELNYDLRLYQQDHEQYIWSYHTNEKLEMPTNGWLPVHEVYNKLSVAI